MYVYFVNYDYVCFFFFFSALNSSVQLTWNTTWLERRGSHVGSLFLYFTFYLYVRIISHRLITLSFYFLCQFFLLLSLLLSSPLYFLSRTKIIRARFLNFFIRLFFSLQFYFIHSNTDKHR